MGSGSLVANVTRRRPSAAGSSRSTRAFDAATASAGTTSVTSHGVLNDGSSKHGKLLRAASGSNCVVT